MKSLLSTLLLFFFFSCTNSPRVSFELSSKEPSQPSIDSLKVRLNLNIASAVESQSLSAVLLTVPKEKYRVEIRALMGISVASLIGDYKDWTVLIPSEEVLIKGKGPIVHLPINPPMKLPMKRLLSWMWGEYLPSGWRLSKKTRNNNEEMTFEYKCESATCKVQVFDGEGGYIRWSEELDGRKISYYHYNPKKILGRIIFKNHEIIDGENKIEIEIDEVDEHPKFSKYTWRMRYDEETTRVLEWY